MTISKVLLSVLVLVAASTRDAAKGFEFVSKKDGEKLAKDGYVELNTAVLNTPEGKVAARATQKGLEAAPAGAVAPTAEAPKAKPLFVIESGIDVPKSAGRGIVGSIYPFEQLAVGQSFFVPKLAKELGSTVSSANARYAEVVEGQTRTNRKGKTVPVTKATRVFVVRSAEKDGVSGARIFRTA